jgi:multidrug transporter EmrE-like cation transporter
MLRTVALAFVQCLLSVGGMGLLTKALHGSSFSAEHVLAALRTWYGAAGCLALFGSFVVMGALLAETRLSVYVPITTGMTFLLTAILSFFMLNERPDWQQWIGMIAILCGVILVATRR